MKYSVYTILILSFFYFSCQKNDPEIAGVDELSAISYSEKIYTQPVNINNQIISVINDGTSTFLNAYDQNGLKVWSSNIDGYIIPDLSFDDLSFLELQKNSQGEVLLNMYHVDRDEETLKSVKFTNYGIYHSEFTDYIHQTDTIIHQTDTIDLQGDSEFTANGIVALSDGTTAVISYWKPNLPDTTFIQMSLYSTSGYHIAERYFILNETVDIGYVYISSSNSLILESYNEADDTKFYIINTQSNAIFVSPVLPIFDLYSFYENSNGHFIFTASTFNASLDYLGLVISISSQGNYLWHKTYFNSSAWMFMSTTETTDGYLFTGFDTKNILVENFDWRTTFNTENVKAVVLKTDFQGNFENNIGWSSTLQTGESTVGAAVLNNENLTFFGGKYDRSIHNTIILKLNQDGTVIN